MSESEWRKKWQNTMISPEQKQTQLFQSFIDKSIAISIFQKFVKFACCLAGASAPVGRIFSIM